MKKILFLFLCCTTGFVQAQYFHRTYYYGGLSPLGTSNGAGYNAYNGSNTGHFIYGHLNNIAIAGARLDIGGVGGPGSPYHYKSYQIFNSSDEDVVINEDVKSLEFANGDGFALVGSYDDENTSPTTQGIYFLLVTPTGTITSVDGYLPGIAAEDIVDIQVTAVTESVQDDEEFYVTGAITADFGSVDYETSPGTPISKVFVLKLNHSGTIVWSYIYDLNTEFNTGWNEIPYGIVEAAYDNGSTYEVIIVGKAKLYNNADPDAFILRLDYSTGLIISQVQYFGSGYFTNIKNSNNTNVDANGKGYIICGTFAPSGGAQQEFWFVAIDQGGTVVWTETYKYDGVNNDVDKCWDIIERFNSSSQYEYYLAGYAENGYFGGSDMMVVKVNASGSAVSNGLFLYGTSDVEEYCYRIDQLNGTSADGICMFGTRKISLNPTFFWMIKAYFNGVTYCDYYITDASQGEGTYNIFDSDGDEWDEFDPEDLLADDYITGAKNVHCYEEEVEGGDNTRQGYIGTKPSQNNNIASIVPNPVNTTSGEVTITLAEANDAPARIMVADMLGRVYYNEVVVPDGVNYKLNIQNQLRPGTYVVNIITAGRSIKQMVLVK